MGGLMYWKVTQWEYEAVKSQYRYFDGISSVLEVPLRYEQLVWKGSFWAAGWKEGLGCKYLLECAAQPCFRVELSQPVGSVYSLFCYNYSDRKPASLEHWDRSSGEVSHLGWPEGRVQWCYVLGGRTRGMFQIAMLVEHQVLRWCIRKWCRSTT